MFYLSAKPLITDKGAEMTRKDYVLIAEALGFAISKANTYKLDTGAIYFAVGALSQTLLQDNPRFDQARFIEAVDKSAEVAA